MHLYGYEYLVKMQQAAIEKKSRSFWMIEDWRRARKTSRNAVDKRVARERTHLGNVKT